ncbi:MAG: hypothetical protein AAGA85_17470 [Bacteroidota bacterium]
MRYTDELFKETQRPNQTLVIWLLVFVGVTTLGPLIYGVTVQIGGGEPWGDRPMSDEDLLIVIGFTTLAMILMSYILIATRIEIVVTKEALTYRFPPFIQKSNRIERTEIESWEVRKFRRIQDFGGWGLHFGWGKKLRSFSIWGDFGVKLKYGSGKSLLIGTQRPEALRQAMTKMMEKE